MQFFFGNHPIARIHEFKIAELKEISIKYYNYIVRTMSLWIVLEIQGEVQVNGAGNWSL